MSKEERFFMTPNDTDIKRDENYEAQKTVFGKKLRRLMIIILIFDGNCNPILLVSALVCVALVFIVLTTRFVITRSTIEEQSFSVGDANQYIIFVVISAVTLNYALLHALPIAIMITYCQKGNYFVKIRKFFQCQLTFNLVATIIAMIGTCVLQDGYVDVSVSTRPPIKFYQVILISLVYGGLAAIALTISTNPGETHLSTDYNQPILTHRSLLNIIGQAIYQLTVLFIFILYGEGLLGVENGRYAPLHSPSVHYTFIFNTFALMSIFNQINARKIFGERNVFQNIHKDFLFVGVFLTEWVIQVLIVQYAHKFFQITPLDYTQWLYCIALALGGLLWQQVIASIPCWK